MNVRIVLLDNIKIQTDVKRALPENGRKPNPLRVLNAAPESTELEMGKRARVTPVKSVQWEKYRAYLVLQGRLPVVLVTMENGAILKGQSVPAVTLERSNLRTGV